MPQRTILKAKGLYTDPNQLSGLPDGAMIVAENVVIDRNDVVESRRGFAQYGNTFGPGADRAKQLLVYKDRILAHYEDKIIFNSNAHNIIDDGNFLEFDGSYSELQTGLRIKAFESNKNLYFTTADGIKKISARTAADFTTAAGFIRDAGAIKALDVTGTLKNGAGAFLNPDSKVAYKVVWSYKDNNDNLIVGTPSSRLVIANYSTTNANVDLQFAIPQNYTSDYFYQVYRTGVFEATGNLTLDDIDPGEEFQLVLEDFPTALQVTAGLVEVTDIAPEDFRSGGLFLYTNPNSGEGILQANEPPPKAKDITMYQNTLFYANTESRARTTISFLGVEDLVSGVSTFSITDGVNPTQQYTFVGEKQTTNINFGAYFGVIPSALNGRYFTLYSAGDKRKYYVWYDTTKTTQTVNFSSYVGVIPADLDSKYFVLFTADPSRTYYVWFDATGSSVDPGSIAATGLAAYNGIRVDISVGVTTTAQVADKTQLAINLNDLQNDFDVTYVPAATSFTIESAAFEDTTLEPIETVQKGFLLTYNTPTSADPGSDLITYNDIVGFSPIRVNISRNVTTTVHLADATAAEILERDNAEDFEITYGGGSSLLVQTKNNGNTSNSADSLILTGAIGNGFAVTTPIEGDGEDALLNQVLLSSAATPGQQIDETARSIVNVINKNNSGSVYAYYLSGASDLPGQILLEAKDIGVNQFSITANNAATGASFNPSLPPVLNASPVLGKAEIKPNRIYFAKLQQPEAVPLLNFIDVGPEDKAILRILALRESLFVFKEDGVYRLTGINGNYGVDLFDGSAKILAPDSAVSLNNQIYCLTNLGICAVSDTGVSIISNPIASTIQYLSSSNFDYKYSTFGVSYENDAAYILFMPSSVTDTFATRAYRFNTVTNTFTTFDISKTCGLVNPGDDKLYLGPADANFIERERKLFNRTDFADRSIDLIIPSNAVTDTLLKLSSSTDVTVGDAVVQTQSLTIDEFNQLLNKIDLDPSIGTAEITEFDFSAVASVGALHGKYTTFYSASDSRRYALFFDVLGTLQRLDTNVFIDIADAEQIRADVSSCTTIAQAVEAAKIAIQSSTFDFVVTYLAGQERFETKTVRNGDTSAASAVTGNSITGLVITVLQEGVGDYFNSLGADQGDNLFSKVTQLAAQLDADPSVTQTDFAAAISIYSGATFEDDQDAFNLIVQKLNIDPTVVFQNYLESEGTKEFEVLIIRKALNTTDVYMQFSMPFIEGPIVVYKGIRCDVQYAPETFGDTSLMKQVSEGTVIFEDTNFSRATVGYRSDLSPGYETTDFTKSGKGDFGYFTFSQHSWGGGFSGVPLRTYVPRQKQRCRFIQMNFQHDSSRERFALYGFSYTYRPVSERAYRG